MASALSIRARPLVPLALGLLMIATSVAYSTSIRAPFQYDDVDDIAGNVTIRKLWPIFTGTGMFHPPARTAMFNRPVVNVSLALNYALNDAVGIDNRGPWAPLLYRVFNITVHLVCVFLLVGVIRRTLRHGWIGEKFADVADLAAVTAAFVWALHPVQSEAVLYIVQRTELMMAACYLGALYCSIRAWDARSAAAAAGWSLAAVVVGLVGMGCKEVMISMPLAVLLYDRAFRNESWRQTFDRRWWFYGLLGLTTSWVIYFVSQRLRLHAVGFNLGIAWFEYLYTQCWAIPHYVQLFFWPDRLTLDYGPLIIRDSRGITGAIALTASGVLTAAVWIKPRWWAWWGAAAAALTAATALAPRPDLPDVPLLVAASITFFVIAALETAGRAVRVSGWVWLAGTLATSTVVLGVLPLRIVTLAPAETHARHAYMAIVSLLVLSTFSLRALAPRLSINHWGWLGFLGAWFFMILAPSSSVVPLTTEVAAERRIYLSLAAVIVLVLLGVEVLRRRLDDPADTRARAWQFVALAAVAIFYLWVSGWLTNRWLGSYGTSDLRRQIVLPVAEWTVRLIVAAGVSCATYVMLRSRAAVRTAALTIIIIGLVAGTAVRGSMYNDTEAIWRDVTLKVPDNPRGWDRLGSTLAEKGRIGEGEAALRRAVATEKRYVPGWYKLGVLDIRQGRLEEGQELLQQALMLDPVHLPSLRKLGALLVDRGRPHEAIAYLERAVAAEPTAADWSAYGVALSQTARYDKALTAFDRSLTLDPSQTEARINKAGTLINAGRDADAVSELRTVLEVDPRSVVAQTNLALAYAGLGRADDAIRAGQAAIDLAPESAHVRTMVGAMLNRLGRFADAERELTIVVLAEPNDPAALFQLGIATYYLGKGGDAIAAFRRALQADANYRPAREALEKLGARPAR